MEITNNKIDALQKKVDEANIQRREAERALKQAKKKQDNHRIFALGEIVIKLFPELKARIPGKTKKENAEIFGQFEAFLQLVASDEKWRELYLETLPK